MNIEEAELLPGKERLLRILIRGLAGWVYRVRACGVERIPSAGGLILISNHVSYVDAVILQLACPRRIRFLADGASCARPFLKWLVLNTGGILLDRAHPGPALAVAAEALKRGEVVCTFPEGRVERTGVMTRLSDSYRILAESSGARVLPVWLESLWGSVFSYSKEKVFWKIPERLPYEAQVFFGTPLAAEELEPAKVRSLIYDLSAEALSARGEFQQHLAFACLRGLKGRQFKTVIVDAFQNGKSLKGGMLLAAALALAQKIRKDIPDGRIGVILPPGLGATLCNLACILAGKTPVNLNFTIGRASNEAAIRKAGLRSIVTADAVVKKLADFPWTEQRLDLGEMMKSLGKAGILWNRILVLLLPGSVLADIYSVPKEGGDAEAGLLFTSGSSGEPKGVVLSHKNILSNIAQIGMILPTAGVPSIAGCLPVFHSFGFTVTLWWPLVSGPKVVTYVSPLETGKVIEMIEKYKIALLVTTPTFLRSYYRKATVEQLGSLNMIVTGAEKLPVELLRQFEEKFPVPVCEGYGMTEGTPVISVNQLKPGGGVADEGEFVTRRVGSTGRMVPGVTVRMRHPETGRDLSIFEQGIIWYKGANIFGGYLGEPEKSAQVLQDGWYMSGDLGRMDEDGFLYIDGRVSRFSKIGGEMVPHGTVEQKLNEAFGKGREDQAVAVASLTEPGKGEYLVLLSAVELDLQQVRDELKKHGYPNLWAPKVIHRVEKIPMLASGKLDLKGLKQLAEEKEGQA